MEIVKESAVTQPKEVNEQPKEDDGIGLEKMQTTMTTKTEAAPARPNKVTHDEPPTPVETPQDPANQLYYAAAIGAGVVLSAAAYLLLRRK